MSKRIFIVIAYDGTDYHGFARLKDDPDTIEGNIDRALKKLTGEDIEVIGASRTDSGVHALCNVAVFDTESSIPAENFTAALNTLLNDTIRIRRSFEVRSDFHPRHTETIKTYRYEIDNEKVANPIRSRYSMLFSYDLDIAKMNEAGKYLVGEHDFKSFCSVHTQALTTVRKIIDINVERDVIDKECVYITVKGHGFLYNMVRIIAGTLMEVGRGRLAPDDIPDILYAMDRTSNPSPTADAKGLTLMDIRFTELEEK